MKRTLWAVTFFVLGFLALVANPASAGDPKAGDPRDRFEGVYAYDDERPPVHFTMWLSIKGKTIKGRIEEPATFGDGTSDKLYANFTGTLFGDKVSFKKKYDGTGGQSHSVPYRGTLDGKTIFGVWKMNGQSGTWYATSTWK